MAESKKDLVLAVDTASDYLVSTLAEIDFATKSYEILATRDAYCRREANVELCLRSDELFAEAGRSWQELSAVLVGRGPGSFTGVRIGISTAKGIAAALDCALYGISTLDGIAESAALKGVEGEICVLADAMRQEVYPGCYRISGGHVERLFASETVLKAKDCAAQLGEAGESLLLLGDGLKKHAEKFAGFSHLTITDETCWALTGEGLIKVAVEKGSWEALGDGDPALVLPIYTRLSDAEESERKRLGLPKKAEVETTGVAELLADSHCMLRPMTINDFDQVVALDELCFADSPHTAWSKQLYQEELEATNRSWWVACDKDQLIGFAGARLAGDDFELLNVCVAPERRREHIAKRLLGRLAYDGQMLNAQSMSLEVAEGNEPAIKLYAGLGFEQVGRSPNYYGPGNAALIMRVALPLKAELFAEEAQIEPRPSIRPWPFEQELRSEAQQEALAAAAPLILSIESSCDETAMAIINGKGEIIANVVATSVDFHARFGGVVPEIASRKHVEALMGVYESVMEAAGAHFGLSRLHATDLAAVGVTAGPGLVGALVVGVAFAKGLGVAAGLPLIGCHHLEGHLLANLFETPDLKPPFVASLVSGGNTMLVHVKAWGDYEILGQTIDDAVGEAFDKVAKALGLGYPGGPVISKLAAEGNRKAIHFPRAMAHSGDYNFSLSGLKTSVITYIQKENAAGRAINLPDLCASFEAAVVDVQVQKALTAVEECGVSDFCVGGGVAANPELRAQYRKHFAKRGVRVTVPPMVVCGDNAAMIALCALRNFKTGLISPITLDANPNAQLGEWSSTELEPLISGDWPHKK